MFSLSRLARLTPRRLLHSLDEADALRTEVDRLQTRVRQLVAAHETTENTTGAHRAAVPSTADPDIVRHLYQLQLGPPSVTQRRLLKQMPAEDAAPWRRQDKDPQ